MSAARPSRPTLVVRGSVQHRMLTLAVVATVAVVVLVAATALADYRLLLFSRVLAFVVAILGLNLVTGLSGQLSMGHSAFIGVGAYTTAILVADHGWPWLATLAPSVAIGFVAGLVLAVPAMRVRGLYLALVTLSIGVLFPTLVRRFQGLTGGSNGKTILVGWRKPSWFKLDVTDGGWRFVVLFVIAVVAYFFARSVVNSAAGRALIALRDNEIAATTFGINLRSSRVLALALSASFGAVAGSMLTLVVPVVSPEGFGFVLAVELITGLVVGGMTRLGGAILGGLLVVWLPYYAAGWSTHLPLFSGSDAVMLANAIYGIILIVITFTMPGGLAAGVERLVSKLVRTVPFRPSADQHAELAEVVAGGPFGERAPDPASPGGDDDAPTDAAVHARARGR